MPNNPIFYIVFVIIAAVIAIISFLTGAAYRRKTAEATIGSANDEARRILSDAMKTAESKKKELILEAKEEIHRIRTEADKELRERRSEVQRQERRIQQKEETLDRKTENLESKEEKINNRSKEISKDWSRTRITNLASINFTPRHSR